MILFLWDVTVSDVAKTVLDYWVARNPDFDEVRRNMLWRLTFLPKNRFEELGLGIYVTTLCVNDNFPAVTFVCRWGGPHELVVLDVKLS